MTFTSPRTFIKFLRKTPVETPNEIYLIPDTEHGHIWSEEPAPTSQHDASESVRYLKADFLTKRLTPNTFDAKPHETYEGLRIQFNALKQLCNWQSKQLDYYIDRDYEAEQRQIQASNERLNSELEANQKLTNDIERLQAEKAELVDVIECILIECTGLDKLAIREDGCSIDLVKVRELMKEVSQ